VSYGLSVQHPSTGKSATELVLSLQCVIEETLKGVIPQGSLAALLDFPDYSNVGDSAIWLGEKKVLKDYEVDVLYIASHNRFVKDYVVSMPKEAILFLTGGGNLGDLWPAHQNFRERIIKTFPDRKIIQLPQSIYFQSLENLKRAKEVFDSHPDFTLLVRDEKSLEFARNEFACKSLLCPDMAFALGPIDKPFNPTQDVVLLSRTDIESLGHFNGVSGKIETNDWLDEPQFLIKWISAFLSDQLVKHPRKLRPLYRPLEWLYDLAAKKRLERGCRFLSSGKIVITDRLHGHILSLLMGISHICLDNSYGKIRNFCDTWTKDCEFTYWANDYEEAINLGKDLLSGYE